MANDVTGNPWVIDTPSANLIWSGNVKVAQIELADYAAATDNATVTDAAGRLFTRLHGTTDLSTVRTGGLDWAYNGLKVTVLTSGKLLIYHKTK